MNKKHWSLLSALFLGIVLIILGFTYDLLFAGIPVQDPTLEQTERFNFHKKIANMAIVLGLFLFVASIAVKTFKILIDFLKKS